MERLIHECSLAFGHTLDVSSQHTYSLALNSYITFCCAHALPLNPTEDTLSFYVVYMCTHIKPDSVDNYLSGICHELEVFFPVVHAVRKSHLVARTLKGCKRMHGTPVHRKCALTGDDLRLTAASLSSSDTYANVLFLTQLFTSFHGLLRLGELVWPDVLWLRNHRKLTLRHTTTCDGSRQYTFLLPTHKVDPFFGQPRACPSITCSPRDHGGFHVLSFFVGRAFPAPR